MAYRGKVAGLVSSTKGAEAPAERMAEDEDLEVVTDARIAARGPRCRPVEIAPWRHLR